MTLFHKKTDEVGLDVLEEIKEPFSFSTFFDEQVVGRVKAAKRFLEEKGILFFFLSPFQQRNRLILELAILVFGVCVGVVPRSNQMLHDVRERNAASEMSSLIEADTRLSVGSVTIRPLASSQYEKQHLLAFYVEGTNAPSTANRYDVALSPARGVTYAEDVTYAYEVVPVSETGRLLLVHVDNREQADETGIYNLHIQVAGEDLGETPPAPMEIVLSNTQETTPLFGEGGVNLSVLTEGVLNSSETPIENASLALSEALDAYELEVERIERLPAGLTCSPTREELEETVTGLLAYPSLTDASTTMDIADMEPVEVTSLESQPVSVTLGDTVYDAQSKAAQSSGVTTITSADEETQESDVLSDEEEAAWSAYDSLQRSADEAVRAATNLNQARHAKFDTLRSYKLVLNQSVNVDEFFNRHAMTDEVASGGE